MPNTTPGRPVRRAEESQDAVSTRSVSTKRSKGRAVEAARAVQYGSATLFAVFTAWHIAAPISAAAGGEMAASQTMLLGRDQWYQRDLFGFSSEGIVVFGAAIAHVGAGAIKRLLQPRKTQVNAHARAGYLLVPIVAAHSFVHRIRPKQAGISPALLSYQFVVHSLHTSPVFSWVAYSLIAVVGTWHSLAGMRKIVSRGRKPAALQTSSWRGGWAAIIASMGVGLARLHAEAPIPLWLAKRYDPLL